MITLNDAVLQRGTRIILDGASLAIHEGQKIGVIGRNGSGKTSLFACLNGSLPLDGGTLNIPAGLRVSYMRQETEGSGRSAVEHVIDGDVRYRELEGQLVEAEAKGDETAMARLHAQLDSLDGYTIVNRAEKLLAGLGFRTEEYHHPVASFSGGWRVRLNLAAALMSPSDLLLLDEPTNHLDLEATLWLEQWLMQYRGTLLIISHDREFLDHVVRYIVSFENRRLQLYRGDFTAYERQKAERLALERSLFEKQQRRRAEIEDFVRRFRAKATKARQAQSRLKELQRMEQISLAHVDSPFEIRIPAPDRLPDTLLTLTQVSVGFSTPLLEKVNLTVSAASRIGLLGVNGSGKSTLLRVLAEECPAMGGEIVRSKHLRIGYFAQHQVDVLASSATPLGLLQALDTTRTEQEIRNYLGGFDFRGARVEEPIGNFSGGEKARLALARIAWQKPNLLLLDEPTNHLDLEMRHALTVALQEFPGAILMVSHDRHLLNNTVNEFYLLRDRRLALFDGDLADYERLWQGGGQAAAPVQAAAPASSSPDRKTQRRLAAERREQLAPLRKQLGQLERRIEALGRELAAIEQSLLEGGLYEEASRERLSALVREQGAKRVELSRLEEQWLSLGETIEREEGGS